MAISTHSGLDLETLGISPKHALRKMLTEFRNRGWRDPGDAALLVIRRIEMQPGISAERAAAAAPAAFFDLNQIQRKDLADLLRQIARR